MIACQHAAGYVAPSKFGDARARRRGAYQVSDDAGRCASYAAIAEPFACCEAFHNTGRVVHTAISAVLHRTGLAQSAWMRSITDIIVTGPGKNLRAGPHWKRVGEIFAVSFITLLKV